MVTLRDIGTYTGKQPDLWMIDYDGTLAIDSRLLESSIRALEIIINKANAVIISARPSSNLYDLFFHTRLQTHLDDKIHISGFNGNQSYYNGELFRNNPLPATVTSQIVDFANTHDLTGIFFGMTDNDVINETSPWLLNYLESTSYRTTAIRPNPNKRYFMIELQVCNDDLKLIERLREIAFSSQDVGISQFQPPFSSMRSAQLLQISYCGDLGGKARTAKQYQSILRSRKTAAIGDGINDKELVCLNGVLGIVMCGSDLLTSLDNNDLSSVVFQTKSVHNDGLLHAVKKVYGD